MNLFFPFVFAPYFVLLLFLIVGWHRTLLKGLAQAEHDQYLFRKITVIVPFRNEASTIEHLIHYFSRQSYPLEYLEVIFVDDHSTDASPELVAKAITGVTPLQLFALSESEMGKKKAITAGVAKATGEIIVTTDADCIPPIHWLVHVNGAFHSENVKMVFGGVRIGEYRSEFSQIQALEFSSLIGSGAATASMGFPTLCNGANLAFRKASFIEVKGYEGNFAVASGDDEFLMRKIQDRFPGSIHFLAEQESVVTTAPQLTIGEFIAQRLRWAGKLKHNSSWSAILLAVFVLVFQTSFILFLALTLSRQIAIQWALMLIVSKLFLEFFLLRQFCSFLQVKWRTFHFLILQLIYPLYIIGIGLASIFLPYRWKERAIKNG